MREILSPLTCLILQILGGRLSVHNLPLYEKKMLIFSKKNCLFFGLIKMQYDQLMREIKKIIIKTILYTATFSGS